MKKHLIRLCVAALIFALSGCAAGTFTNAPRQPNGEKLNISIYLDEESWAIVDTDKDFRFDWTGTMMTGKKWFGKQLARELNSKGYNAIPLNSLEEFSGANDSLLIEFKILNFEQPVAETNNSTAGLLGASIAMPVLLPLAAVSAAVDASIAASPYFSNKTEIAYTILHNQSTLATNTINAVENAPQNGGMRFLFGTLMMQSMRDIHVAAAKLYN